MSTLQRTPPYGGAFLRRFTRFTGIYFDAFSVDSAWIRECGWIRLPPMEGVAAIVVRGSLRGHPDARGLESGFPALTVLLNERTAGSVSGAGPGSWEVRIALDPQEARGGAVLGLRLKGVWLTNALAWLGRITGFGPIQRFRAQNRNRQLRISSVESETGEAIYDFSRRESPYSVAFARLHARTGMNVVGFFSADLGIGESARCMARAADAASIPTCLVPLKLNCRNRLGDTTFIERLTDDNLHGVNVFHVDPPVARDIDHHHGAAFRKDRYNIGYFAWELPEFPDAWMPALDYFDEIWCPSDFVRESIALKSPFPVLTMPHAIGFPRPTEAAASIRARLRLPKDAFLFLCLFDLNSYVARKNPRAAIEAFRMSALGGPDAALVIKVQNAEANSADFAALAESVRDLPGAVILSETLSRADVYALESACDCFVSLHRSEGFGLAIGEAMYLGKPVIATGWSAPAEYLGRENGLPVRYKLVELAENHGPYTKGSTWAEPDAGHAAELMRWAATHRAEASALGAAAQRTMEERFSARTVGARYRKRLETIASL